MVKHTNKERYQVNFWNVSRYDVLDRTAARSPDTSAYFARIDVKSNHGALPVKIDTTHHKQLKVEFFVDRAPHPTADARIDVKRDTFTFANCHERTDFNQTPQEGSAKCPAHENNSRYLWHSKLSGLELREVKTAYSPNVNPRPTGVFL